MIDKSQYAKIHKIYSINDLDNFVLVNVNAKHNKYARLFVVIPKINQIQCVASDEYKNEWSLWKNEYRTTFDKLSKRWSCHIDKQFIAKDEALIICPELKNIIIIVGQKKS